MSDSVTVIRNADWVIAWDSQARRHVYLRGADVAFRGGVLVHVGRGYTGRADTTVDGSSRLVMPGLVDIHSHLSGGSVDKGIFDDTGARALYGHALYTHSPLLRLQDEDMPAAATTALCELLLSGVTTTVDISQGYPGWLELMGASGMRVVLAQSFRQARWVNVGDHRVEYDWNDKAGWEGLERALELAEAAGRHPCGRLSGLIMPAQADTCSAELFRASFAEAQRRNLPFQTHAAQSMVEFQEMLRRHGVSPVRWLDELGVLGERTILGHCIYLDHHSWSPLRSEEDLPLLVQRKVTVAHCPTVFGLTGMTMQSAGGYLRKGVRLGIGTDSYPFNMLEELRHAVLYSRITAGSVFDLATAEAFHAATVGGARALGRPDLGRLTAGARADLVVVDTAHPLMRPLRDPLRHLIYVAGERAIREVFVDGRQVVRDGEVATLDRAAALDPVDRAQRRMIERVPQAERAGRSLDEVAPLCFELRDAAGLQSGTG